jgi:5-methylcytosine-specific restriction enzyme subunit McrC
MRHAALRPKRTDLLCEFSEFTTDHCLHQVLAAGLRLAARLVQDIGLRGDLIRTAEQFFGGHQRLVLDHKTLTRAQISLDRRSRHYEPALKLVTLLYQGSCLANHVPPGDMSLSGFLLDMNRLFESFLTRHLQAHAPEGTEVIGQETRTDVFAYQSNPQGWREPVIRPDLVFRRHGETIAIGDAKYRDHRRRAPSTAELYQLTTYGLAYSMTTFREVWLFYPLAGDSEEPSPRLLFAPGGSERVRIRLAGVPIDDILAGKRWWPCLALD